MKRSITHISLLLGGAALIVIVAGRVTQQVESAEGRSIELAIDAGTLALQEIEVTPAGLRRLAAAAEANATGEPMFFLVNPEYPNDVIGPYADLAAAGPDRESHEQYRLVGPITVPIPPEINTALPHCRKPVYSSYDCVLLLPDFSMRDAVAAKLVFIFEDKTIEIPFPPREVDAFVFSFDAYDKFLLPHYIGVLGPVGAMALRDSVRAEFGDTR
jgi:hypothetical protein